MKSVEIMVGYKDKTGRIKAATAHWPVVYGVRPIVRKFGTLDKPHHYQRNWERRATQVEEEESMARLGISFGAGVQARTMIDYPDKVPCAIFVAGALDLSGMDSVTVDETYPMLNYSLPAFDTTVLPGKRIMTVASHGDQLMRPEAVAVEGAQNLLTPGRSHATAILSALTLRASEITDFIKEH